MYFSTICRRYVQGLANAYFSHIHVLSECRQKLSKTGQKLRSQNIFNFPLYSRASSETLLFIFNMCNISDFLYFLC